MKYVEALPEVPLPLDVSVTAEDIAQYRRTDITTCAIRRAILRALGNPVGLKVVVGSLAAVFSTTSRKQLEVMRVPLPLPAKTALVRLDCKLDVQPFTFKLCTPCSAKSQ